MNRFLVILLEFLFKHPITAHVIVLSALTLLPFLIFWGDDILRAILERLKQPIHYRFTLRSLLILVAGVAVFAGWYRWYYNPSRLVPVLLGELADRPRVLDFDFSRMVTTRSVESVCDDLDAYGTDATPALLEALDDPDKWVRYWAAMQLQKLGDRRATQPLTRTLQHDYERVYFDFSSTCPAEVAAWALGDLRDPAAVDSLIAAMRNADAPMDVRLSAVEALGKIGDQRAVEPLRQIAIDAPDEYLRLAASRTLTMLGSSAP